MQIYAPSSGDHPECFEKVIREVVRLDYESTVIGCDWNVALNPKIDSNHPTNIYRARSQKQIVDFMNTYDLVDVYRNLHVDTRRYSWRRFNGTQRSRIDYFLVSEHLGLDIAGADIMPGYCSGHSLVYIGLKSDIVKRHCPLWKFKNSLLPDRVFVNLVKQVNLDLKRRGKKACYSSI